MPTATPPPYGQVFTLGSGNAFLVEWTWSLGELMVGLAVLGLAGLLLLHWLRQLAQGKG